MTKIEIWKDINGYQGLYKVSTFGNVKTPRGKITKGWFVNGKYKKVRLYKNGTRKDFYLHRLVAIAFLDNPQNKSDVNHKDSNPENNHLSNLEWCTHQENIQHASRNNRLKRQGKKVKNIKTGEVFQTIDEAAKKYNIIPNTLIYQLKRKSKICQFEFI